MATWWCEVGRGEGLREWVGEFTVEADSFTAAHEEAQAKIAREARGCDLTAIFLETAGWVKNGPTGQNNEA